MTLGISTTSRQASYSEGVDQYIMDSIAFFGVLLFGYSLVGFVLVCFFFLGVDLFCFLGFVGGCCCIGVLFIF